jgi:hypothetical protein
MHARPQACLLAALVAGSVLLAPVAAASALPTGPMLAVVACDPTTNTVSASLTSGAGWFTTPNQPVTVEFLVSTGSYATTTGTSGTIPTGSRTTVAATIAADGSLNVAGYTRTWPAASYLFYTETARVAIRNSAGQQLYQRDGTCTHDLRTVVRVDCDTAARTITASAAGTSYPADGSVRVTYRRTTTHQTTRDGPRFTSSILGPGADASHVVRASASGVWSDVGWVQTVTTDYYYLDQKVDVEVVHPQYGFVIGRGSASCVYADQRS